MTQTQLRPSASDDTHKQAARGAARFGLIARGVMFALLGVLAARLAFGNGGANTDSQGALRTVASGPFGTVLLGLLTVGLAVYAGWQLYEAWSENDWKSRISAAVRGVIWGALALTAGRYALSGNAGSSNQEESITAAILNMPFGTWVVGAVGVVIIAVGLAFLTKLRKRSYLDDLCPLPAKTTKRVCAAAITGMLGRALVFALAGAFLLRAAVTHEADSGVGLDGTLSGVAQAPYGTYVLAAVAIGMVAYAVWCFIRARYEDIDRSDG